MTFVARAGAGLARDEPFWYSNPRTISPLDHARVVGTGRDGLGIAQVVETEMQRPARDDGHPLGASRFPILEEEGQRDVRVRVEIARVEQTRRFVARELRLWTVAPGRAFSPDATPIGAYVASGKAF
jgi:hypothetical protein